MIRAARAAALLGAAFLVVACGPPDRPAAASRGGEEQFDMDTVDFAPELSVNLDAMTRLPSGVYVQDLKLGKGQVVQDRAPVYVNYTGWLPDGTQFDTSRQRGVFSFMVGAGRVIPGWEAAVKGMKPGGVRRVVIPPSMGYGPHGAGDGTIPPNSVLVFEIQVVDVLPPAPL